MNFISIDQKFNKIERSLSRLAATPVVGTPFGLIKVLMGSGQLITSLAIGILSLPLRFTSYYSLNDYCWSHVMHGLGNIAAGALEAIPFIGLKLYLARKNATVMDLSKDDEDFNDWSTLRYTYHHDKIMPYESLVNRDSIWVNYNLSKDESSWSWIKNMDDPADKKNWKPLVQLLPSLKLGYDV